MKIGNFIILFLFFTSGLVAQNVKDSKISFEEYETQCNFYNKKRLFDSSNFYLAKMDSVLGVINDSTYVHRRQLIEATILIGQSKYEEAMEKLLHSQLFFKYQQDSSNYYLSKYKIAVCNYYVNRRDLAKSILQEVLQNPSHITDQMATNALANIGVINLEHGIINKNETLVKKAIPNFKKAIAINLKNQEYTYLASNYSLLAECHIQLKEYIKAILLLDSAIHYANKDENLSQKGFALIKKANVLTQTKQYPQATILIENAIDIFQTANDLPTLIYAFLEKKKLMVEMGQYKTAVNLSDSIYNLGLANYDKRFADGITEMETKYKTAEKERKILIQRADIAEKNLIIQERNYQIFAIAGFVILLLFLAYFIYNQQQLKNNQLVKENKLKVALQVIETQNKLQEQRLRISRDLHDNIGAQLSFIISSIDNLKFMTGMSNSELKEKLSYISIFTTTTIHQLRDTIWSMNKNEIKIGDLQSRVLSFLENAKKANTNINIEFEIAVSSDITFTSINGINIFRAIQEAVNNALKHALADNIKIKIVEFEKELEISITDNGVGFDYKELQLGNGLTNIQSRIDEIGGELKIDSAPTKGTVILITCNKDSINKP